MNRWPGLCAVAASLLAASASATFHTFKIEEVFSNGDGTVQFVVLREVQGLNNQNLLRGQTLTATRGTVSAQYVFPADLPGDTEMSDEGYGYGYGMGGSPTARSRVLIATPGFVKLGVVTPDYVIPNGFLPIDHGTVNYAGVDQWSYTALPTDGVNALFTNGAYATNLATNFAGMSASVAVAATPPTLVNYEGLWWKSPAGSESGWGINFAHQDDVIFATWFTYDLAGKAWWLSMTANKTADGVYAGTLFQTRGPAFNAVPFSPGAVTATAVGTGTLTFSDGNSGSFAYTVNGVSQTKAITRQVFATLPTCTFGAQPNLALAGNYQDLWWAAPAGAESGWGVNFTHQSETIFATWFTYDFDGTPLWLSVTAPKTGPGVYAGTLYRTTGPAFNAVPFDPAKVGLTPVGALTLTFANGNSASYAYTVTLPGQSSVTQTKSIVRQVFRTPGTVCQ